MARQDEPFPYPDAPAERDSPPRHFTTASALVALGVILLVSWLGHGPAEGESQAEYFSRLLFLTLLGELACLVVAALVTAFTRADVLRGQVAFRAGTCLLIGAVFLGWAAVLAVGGAVRGEHELMLATVFLTLGALDLLALSVLCFLRLRPRLSWSAARLVRRLALLALPFWIVPGCVLLLVPHTHGHSHSSPNLRACVNNCRQISTVLSERSIERGWPEYGGKNFVLSLVVDGVVDPEESRNREFFFCPEALDAGVAVPEAARYRALTPARLREHRFPDLTSYAGLRLEDRAERLAAGDIPIVGCAHGGEGVVLGYSDGSAAFLDREDLGLGPDEAIVFGPDSPDPRLRHLSDE